jgi:hypothetical protein
MNKIVQVAAGLALALPLAVFAIANAGGGPLFGNTAFAGYGQEKVEICHKGKTITVAAPAVPAHEKHGDTVGPCPS